MKVTYDGSRGAGGSGDVGGAGAGVGRDGAALLISLAHTESKGTKSHACLLCSPISYYCTIER